MKELIKYFNDGFKRFCSKRNVSLELKPLLSVIYNQIQSPNVNLQPLKESLVNLMSFLIQSENRTDANCRAVDLFFCIEDHWNKRWDDLPQEYQQILDDIGGYLHDTVSFPETAKNFDSSPEQFLDRISKLETN
jgi:hypothetical protein